MRKQLNKWFSHSLTLQPWKVAKVRNLFQTDKCNWVQFSQSSLPMTTTVDLNSGNVTLIFSVDISMKLLCHEDFSLARQSQVSLPPLTLKIFPHIYSLPSLSPPLVWDRICIPHRSTSFAVNSPQQTTRNSGRVSKRKWEWPLYKNSTQFHCSVIFEWLLLGTSIDAEKRKRVSYRGWTLDREKRKVFIYDHLLHCLRCSLSGAVSDHKSLALRFAISCLQLLRHYNTFQSKFL